MMAMGVLDDRSKPTKFTNTSQPDSPFSRRPERIRCGYSWWANVWPIGPVVESCTAELREVLSE